MKELNKNKKIIHGIKHEMNPQENTKGNKTINEKVNIEKVIPCVFVSNFIDCPAKETPPSFGKHVLPSFSVMESKSVSVLDMINYV